MAHPRQHLLALASSAAFALAGSLFACDCGPPAEGEGEGAAGEGEGAAGEGEGAAGEGEGAAGEGEGSAGEGEGAAGEGEGGGEGEGEGGAGEGEGTAGEGEGEGGEGEGEGAADPCVGDSNVGCEFFAVKTPQIATGTCFTVSVTGVGAVHVVVDRGGPDVDLSAAGRVITGLGPSKVFAPYDAAAGLAAGETLTVFLSSSQQGTCPVTPAFNEESAVAGTGRSTAFHVVTDGPSVVTSAGAFASFGTNSELLYPTTVWGDNYVVVEPAGTGTNGAHPTTLFVASADDTSVTVTPTSAITGATGVAATSAGVPVTYRLQRGEVVQIDQAGELSGSFVSADKPFAVLGAHECLSVPDDVGFCDYAAQQLPPVHALGLSYVAAPYPAREPAETTFHWRLVGVVDNTQLSFAPAVPGAPTSLQAHQVADITSTGPFTVAADQPVSLSAYMSGGEPFDQIGDPDWVVVPANAQYVTGATFDVDAFFPDSNLVVVRLPDQQGAFEDVTLDCAGVITGFAAVGDAQIATVSLVAGAQAVDGCSSGPHLITSAAPFSAVVWSVGTATDAPDASIATHAGASWRPVNDVVAAP